MGSKHSLEDTYQWENQANNNSHFKDPTEFSLWLYNQTINK